MGWLILASSLISISCGSGFHAYLSDMKTDFPEGWEDALSGDPDRLSLLCGIVAFLGGVLFILGFFEICYRNDIPAVKLILGEVCAVSMLLVSYLTALVNERYSAVYDSLIGPYKDYLNSDSIEKRSYANKIISGMELPESLGNWHSLGMIIGIVGGVLAVVFLLKFAEVMYSKNKASAEGADVCISCGKVLADGAHFCTRCGTSQTPAGKVCINCGKSLEEYAMFCSACGTEQYTVDTDDDIFYDEDGGEYVICSNCGTIISANVTFCGKCGKEQ